MRIGSFGSIMDTNRSVRQMIKFVLPFAAGLVIMHGTQLVLVDQAAKIRGYYATNDEQALRKIVNDAATLSP